MLTPVENLGDFPFLGADVKNVKVNPGVGKLAAIESGVWQTASCGGLAFLLAAAANFLA